MKQTRLLSEISRLSEYTRLYSIHQSIRIQITCNFPGGGGGVRTPFPPLDPRMKTHSSDVCSWFEDVHVMCFVGHYRQSIFSVTFL